NKYFLSRSKVLRTNQILALYLCLKSVRGLQGEICLLKNGNHLICRVQKKPNISWAFERQINGRYLKDTL
ncbi:hypothetical protein P3514_25585, partial [Vibrio parahaemolyticus]|nr:hypothetical protein [Vibrio parahaemolyticus]